MREEIHLKGLKMFKMAAEAFFKSSQAVCFRIERCPV